MSRHIALLRAVNLGPHGKIAMADLRALFERLGYGDPRTVAATGNVVFDPVGCAPEEIEHRVQAALEADLGLNTEVFVRDAPEWAEVVAGNPFADMARDDPSHLVVMTLRAAPDPAQVGALQAAITGREQVRAFGRHAYLTYPDNIGESKVTIRVIERHLATVGTARNWNTVMKLAALSAPEA